MKIAISGATGFLGRHLAPFLVQHKHEVIRLVRDQNEWGIYWNPDTQEIDTDSLNGIDAVIHLAGESVAERWTNEKKNRILQSRVQGTRLLAEALSRLQKPPSDLLCASAIGFYGERGAEVLTEESEPGRTFLANVCVAWESAAESASRAGIRTSHMRFGIILSTTGGAFPRMLAPFEMGAGGRLGNGKQYMSWITLTDAVRAVDFVLSKRQLAGPVNVTAPMPITNADFTETLSRVIGKPALIPVPATMAYLAYGNEMTDEVLLASDRAVPERLSLSGFDFKYPKLEAALQHIVGERA